MNSAEPNVDYDDEHSLVYPVVAIHAGHDLLAGGKMLAAVFMEFS